MKNSIYKCVNCGSSSTALYKTYGASVLKLNKCEKCNGVVDKYIEYDPVIVMIDLVLMSKEALRHVLYNSEFQSYWKLLIVLIMLETFGMWRNDSLFNLTVDYICQYDSENMTMDNGQGASDGQYILDLSSACGRWTYRRKDDADLFVWEKDYYVLFLATFVAIVSFLLTAFCLMRLISAHNRVTPSRLVKWFSLCYVSTLLALATLVWGSVDMSPRTRAAHYTLGCAYSAAFFYNGFSVLYNCHPVVAVLVLSACFCVKYCVTFCLATAVWQLVW